MNIPYPLDVSNLAHLKALSAEILVSLKAHLKHRLLAEFSAAVASGEEVDERD